MSLHGLCDPTLDTDFCKISYVDNLPIAYTETDIIPDKIQYYIARVNSKLNLHVQLSNIKGCDYTRSLIGNIPTNYLNKKHRVYLLFIKNGSTYESDPNSWLIRLEKKSSINYADEVNFVQNRFGTTTSVVATNTVYIKYCNLFGVPLSCFDTQLAVVDTNQHNILVDVAHPAVVDPNRDFYHATDFLNCSVAVVNKYNGGGTQCYVKKVNNCDPAYAHPNSYLCKLDRTYKNIAQIKLISSIFPNSQKTITDSNNKLYWRNISDGDHIYSLTISPGCYHQVQQLREAIESSFNKTIRCQYLASTPTTYDANGYNKYHLVCVDVSEVTGTVSISSFKEIIQTDVLTIPHNLIEFTTAVDLRINFGIQVGTNIDTLVPHRISPFNPDVDTLFIYFTPNSHSQISKSFRHDYYRLYVFTQCIRSDTNGFTFSARLESDLHILLNFHRTKMVYPCDKSNQELRSINTTTILDAFDYDFTTGKVYLLNHNLNTADIIVTDQFHDLSMINEVFVYEIISIIDMNNFVVKRYAHGDKYKFIYDSIIINFSTDKNSHFWLDQILPHDLVAESDIVVDGLTVNNTLSIVTVVPKFENQILMYVRHPNHELEVGQPITISNSAVTNGIAPSAINRQHYIYKIVDDDQYVVVLEVCACESADDNTSNMISIKYPDMFQLIFEPPDTMGKILGFKCGDRNTTTPYDYVITTESKLQLCPYNYFYICSPVLALVQNTQPVQDAFAPVYWSDNPGSLINTSVPVIKNFDPILSTLTDLFITIRHPNGELVDFDGLDHSICVEIIELKN